VTNKRPVRGKLLGLTFNYPKSKLQKETCKICKSRDDNIFGVHMKTINKLYVRALYDNNCNGRQLSFIFEQKLTRPKLITCCHGTLKGKL
jgi:hypothetical protein